MTGRATLFARLLLLSAFLAVVAAPRVGHAQVSAALTQFVSGRRKEATRLQEAGKVEEAVATLAKAKERVQQEGRKARRPIPTTPMERRFNVEMTTLLTRYQKDKAKAGNDSRRLAALALTLKKERTALEEKYLIPKLRAAMKEDQDRIRRVQAPYWLLLSDLDDQIAGLHSVRKDDRRALALRSNAEVQRIHAYDALKRDREALAAIDRFLKLNPSDPMQFDAAGRFYQERKHWDLAADLWRKAIQRIEGQPGGEASASLQLEQYYRQLAYCCLKLNLPDEQRKAMARAETLRRKYRARS